MAKFVIVLALLISIIETILVYSILRVVGFNISWMFIFVVFIALSIFIAFSLILVMAAGSKYSKQNR